MNEKANTNITYSLKVPKQQGMIPQNQRGVQREETPVSTKRRLRE